MTVTFGSLFAGIGGIDLGLERAGMRCAWQVEIDDYCTRVLTKHWPDVPKFRDVRSVGAHNLPRVDLIAGGFPCQDISNAGRRRGIDGERSGLWSEFARIIRELRPRYALVENVPALLGRGFSRVLGDLAAIGYDAEWQCLPAAAFGAPHIRDRVFILAYTDSAERRTRTEGRYGADRDDAGRQEAPGGFTTCGADGRSATVGVAHSCRCEWACSHIRSGRQEQAPLIARGASADVSDADSERRDWRRIILQTAESSRFPHPEGDHPWITEPRMGRVAHGIPNRMDRLRGLGNAVVPQVAEYIGRAILESL